MRILVVGGGAREHALTWKLARSPKVKEIYVAPGNAGTARIAHNITIDAADIQALAVAAKANHIDLTVVGPETPLAAGIVDLFNEKNLPIFGCTQRAAEIESSKSFAKALCAKYKIPCAGSASFSDFQAAADYVERRTPPIVVKADGLAAGKGVVIAQSKEEAIEALHSFMQSKSLGTAGQRVLIEEFLSGKEMSAFVFTDGQAVVPMVPACDYKRVNDGDLGPNTGGMGSFSPPAFLTPALAEAVQKQIMAPTVKAMRDEGRPYQGVLYGGLMVNNGQPKVLEFNARFGDPETQVVLPRLRTDLVEIIQAIIDLDLPRVKVEWRQHACVGVVMASGGYPGSFTVGKPVSGLEDVDKDVMVFHAGTRVGPTGSVLTSGGRVLTVVATGKDLAAAREKAYANVSRIHFEGCHYRRDIAKIEG